MCCICLEPLLDNKNTAILECGHILGLDCYVKNALLLAKEDKKVSCPICRHQQPTMVKVISEMEIPHMDNIMSNFDDIESLILKCFIPSLNAIINTASIDNNNTEKLTVLINAWERRFKNEFNDIKELLTGVENEDEEEDEEEEQVDRHQDIIDRFIERAQNLLNSISNNN